MQSSLRGQGQLKRERSILQLALAWATRCPVRGSERGGAMLRELLSPASWLPKTSAWA